MYAIRSYYVNGDAFMGGLIGGLILLGIKRGAFSNEAGIGTAPFVITSYSIHYTKLYENYLLPIRDLFYWQWVN